MARGERSMRNRRQRLDKNSRSVARGVRTRRKANREKEARQLIDLLIGTGIPDRQRVLLLVVGSLKERIVGYTNLGPIEAARALIAYLKQHDSR